MKLWKEIGATLITAVARTLALSVTQWYQPSVRSDRIARR